MPPVNPANLQSTNEAKAEPQFLSATSLSKQLLTYFYRYFNILTVLLVIVSFTLSFLYLLYPKYTKVFKGAEVSRKQEEYNQKVEYLSKLNQLREAYEAVAKTDKDKINAIINNTNNKDELFNEMQALALREQITLDSMDVQPLEPGYQLENLAANDKRSALFERLEVVKTTAKLNKISYEALQNALRTLEVNLRLMDVQKVTYDPQNNSATLELLTYQLRQ